MSSNVGGLVGGILGAVVGSFFGFTAAGFSIGASLGSSLFAETKEVTKEGPRLDDLKAKQSNFGEPLPIIYGNYRTAVTEIWRENNKLKEVRREETQESGGKGGGGGTETTTITYDYYLTAAFTISEGKIGGVRRIWAGSTLIYDGTENPSPEAITKGADVIQNADEGTRATNSNISEQSEFGLIKIYRGTLDQPPDPRIEADVGVGRTPAYRGVAYMIIEDMKLNKWGNTKPPIEVETASKINRDPRIVTELTPNPQSTKFSNNNAQSAVYNEGAIEILNIDDTIYRVDTYSTNGALVQQGEEKEWNTGGWELKAVCNNNVRLAIAFKDKAFGKSKDALILDGRLLGDDSAVIRTDPDHPDFRGYVLNQGRNFVELNGKVFLFIGFPNNNGEYFSKFSFGTSGLFLESWVNLRDALGTNAPAREIQADENGYIWIREGKNLIKLNQDPKVVEIKSNWLDTDGVGKNFVVWQGLFYGQEADFGEDAKLVNLETGNVISKAIEVSSVQPLNGGPLAFADKKYIVSIEPQMSQDGIEVSKIVSDISQRANIDAVDIDTSELSKTVTGYGVGKPTQAKQAISKIRPFGQFDIAEIDYNLKFVSRGKNPIRKLTKEDLAAHGEDSDRPEVIEENRELETELPFRFHVKYSDVERDFEDGEQYAERQTVKSTDEARQEAPIAIFPNEAAQLADVLLRERWQSRTKISAATSWKHLDLTPADVITVEDFDGGERTGRITKIDDGRPGLIELELVSDGPNVYQSSAKGVANEKGTNVPSVGGPTNLVLMNLPPLRSQDNDAGFYVAMSGVLDGWSGATLFESTDGGDNFDTLTTSTTKAGIATAENILASGPTSIWDRKSTLNVRSQTASFQSRTEDAVLNGQGILAVKAGDEWEIVQYANAKLESDGTYTLSKFLRGRKGTEHLVGLHQKGDTVVVLKRSDGGILKVDEELDGINMERTYSAVTIGNTLNAANSEKFTPKGIGLRPFSPAQLKASQNGGDFTFDWERRVRVNGEWRNNVNVPLLESPEEYQVVVRDNNGNDLRSETVTSKTFNYTKTDQTDDGISERQTFEIAIAQKSQDFGPGVERNGTFFGGGYFGDFTRFDSLDNWPVQNDVAVKSNVVFNGTKSLEFTSNGVKNAGVWVPQELQQPKEIIEFEFYYQEDSNSNGAILELQDKLGNVVIAIGTNNPQLEYRNGGSVWENPANGDTFAWIRARLYDIEWITGEHKVTWENVTNGNTITTITRTYSEINKIAKISVSSRAPDNGATTDSSSTAAGSHWWDNFKIITR